MNRRSFFAAVAACPFIRVRSHSAPGGASKAWVKQPSIGTITYTGYTFIGYHQTREIISIHDGHHIKTARWLEANGCKLPVKAGG